MSEPSSKRGLPTRLKMRHSAHFVDELTHRHEAPVGKTVPISAVEPNPDQPRTHVGDLADLTASIRERGVLEPILVRPLASPKQAAGGADPGVRFQIIAGERRFRAAMAAGLYEIPVIELDVGERESLELALIENLLRKDLTAFEEAEGYRSLADQHQYTQEQIALVVGRARSSIAESLALLAIPAKLRDTAMAMGITAKSALLEIAKAGDAARMAALIERVGRHGLRREDVRREQRGKRRPGTKRKPYVFRFRDPDRTFAMSLSFRQSTVDRKDLIRAMERILAELRRAEKDS